MQHVLVRLPGLVALLALCSCGGGGGGGGGGVGAAPSAASRSGDAVAVAASLVPSQLTTVRTATANQARLTAGKMNVAGQRTSGGQSQLVLDTAQGAMSASLDPNTGAAVLQDDAARVRVLSEAGPMGTVLRVYSTTDNQFLTGFFIEGLAGARTLWRMKADAGTDPSNLEAARSFAATGPVASQAAALRTAQRLASSGGSCHGFMTDLTGSIASFTQETGEALEQDDNPELIKRMGRVSRFLSSIWSRVPTLCPDAPDPSTDAGFAKETVLEAIRQAGPEGVRELMERYGSFQEYVIDLTERAKTLKLAFDRMTRSERESVGSAQTSQGDPGTPLLASDPARAIQEAQDASAPALVYVSGALTCMQTNFTGGQVVFTNGCGEPVRLAWCFSSGVLCNVSSEAIVDSTLGLAPPAGSTIMYFAGCPATFGGRTVNILQRDATFSCTYLSR